MKKIILLFSLISNITFTNAQYWKSVSAGGSFSMAIKLDNTLWGFGQGVFGQLGNGSHNSTSCPTRVNNPTYWQSVSSGDIHSIAIKSDGTLWAWGDDRYGQLGDGTNIFGNFVYTPTQVGTANNWMTISSGDNYTLAIKTDGTLWAWGDNHTGQFGDGTIVDKYIPTQIGSATDWQSISGGSGHSLAIKNDHTLWAWGDNYYGNVGNGTNTNSSTPMKIGSSTNWQSISAGNEFSLGIKSDGTLWAWGYNVDGQLGDGTNIDKNIPTQIGTSTNWQSVSTGWNHSIGIKNDGTLWGWGYNVYGQLGDGTNIDKNVPSQIGVSTNWQSVSGGGDHSLGIQNDGTLWAWGFNGNGESGDIQFNQYIPNEITCEAVLPIKLVSFTAQKQETNTLLSWQTATEQNNKEYQIERSADGITFNKIAVVASDNNISGSHYSYVDAQPLLGQNYYRLKSVDIDGKYIYSNIKEVTFHLLVNQVKVYPNPVKDILSIESNFKEEKISISVTDLAGRKILQTIKPNNPVIEIPISVLKTGLYLLKISDGITVTSKKIIKE